MASALYIITFSRSRWWIDTDGRQHGPHGTRGEAITSAIDAAYVFGEPGVVVEVVAPDPTGRYRVVWTSNKDPYPPPLWLIEDEGPGQSLTPPAAIPEPLPEPEPELASDQADMLLDKPPQAPWPPAIEQTFQSGNQFGGTFLPLSPAAYNLPRLREYPISVDPGQVYGPLIEASSADTPELQGANEEEGENSPSPPQSARIQLPAADSPVRNALLPEAAPVLAAPGPEPEPIGVDELMLSFQLTRDTIAGWSAEAVHYLEAADVLEQGGEAEEGVLASAERSIVAIRMEIEGLLDVAGQTTHKSDDLVNGITAAITEMENLLAAITSAIERLRRFPT